MDTATVDNRPELGALRKRLGMLRSVRARLTYFRHWLAAQYMDAASPERLQRIDAAREFVALTKLPTPEVAMGDWLNGEVAGPPGLAPVSLRDAMTDCGSFDDDMTDFAGGGQRMNPFLDGFMGLRDSATTALDTDTTDTEEHTDVE